MMSEKRMRYPDVYYDDDGETIIAVDCPNCYSSRRVNEQGIVEICQNCGDDQIDMYDDRQVP